MGQTVIQTYTANGSLTIPANVKYIEVIANKLKKTFSSVNQGHGSYYSPPGFIDVTGRLWMWGLNAKGDMGDGAILPNSIPVLVQGALIQPANATTGQVTWKRFARTIGAVYGISFGIDAHNSVWVWGDSSATVPNGAFLTAAAPNSSPVAVTQAAEYIQAQKIFGLSQTYFYIDIQQRVWAWGYNANGQLGINTSTATSGPVLISAPIFVKEIVTACEGGGPAVTTAFLTTSGAVYCTGLNNNGILGYGTPSTSVAAVSSPVAVIGGYTYQNIVPALNTSTTVGTVLGLLTSGTLVAWGGGVYGCLGNGSSADASSPVAVSGGRSYSAIFSGANCFYAIDTSNALWCWGQGTLPIGTGGNKSSPTLVAGSSSITPVKVITNPFTTSILILDAAGNLWGMGANTYGECGNNAAGTFLSSPTAVVGGNTWVDVAFFTDGNGQATACGLDVNGAVWAWGSNTNGNIGNGVAPGTTAAYSSPIMIAPLQASGQRVYPTNMQTRQRITVTPNTSYAIVMDQQLVKFGTTVVMDDGPVESVQVIYQQ